MQCRDCGSTVETLRKRLRVSQTYHVGEVIWEVTRPNLSGSGRHEHAVPGGLSLGVSRVAVPSMYARLRAARDCAKVESCAYLRTDLELRAVPSVDRQDRAR